jgi:hypothetical protein
MKNYNLKIVKFFLSLSLGLTLTLSVLWYLGAMAQIADGLGF